MGSMASDVARYLAANGFGSITSPGPTITSNFMSDTPDNQIGVYDQMGEPPARGMSRVDHEVRNLQILVRNLNPAAGELIARNVWKFLDMKVDLTIESTRYLSILAKSSPFALGSDENKRSRWSCNYEVRKDVSA